MILRSKIQAYLSPVRLCRSRHLDRCVQQSARTISCKLVGSRIPSHTSPIDQLFHPHRSSLSFKHECADTYRGYCSLHLWTKALTCPSDGFSDCVKRFSTTTSSHDVHPGHDNLDSIAGFHRAAALLLRHLTPLTRNCSSNAENPDFMSAKSRFTLTYIRTVSSRNRDRGTGGTNMSQSIVVFRIFQIHSSTCDKRHRPGIV